MISREDVMSIVNNWNHFVIDDIKLHSTRKSFLNTRFRMIKNFFLKEAKGEFLNLDDYENNIIRTQNLINELSSILQSSEILYNKNIINNKMSLVRSMCVADILIISETYNISLNHRNNSLCIHIPNVQLDIHTSKIDLGDMNIVFGDNLSIRIEPVMEKHPIHPHITGTTPCFGNIKDSIYRLLKFGEFLAAFNLILNWLPLYNAESCFHKLSYFLPSDYCKKCAFLKEECVCNIPIEDRGASTVTTTSTTTATF